MRGERKDRVPLMFAGDTALIRYAKPETTFRFMIEEHEAMTQTIVDEVLPHFPKLDFLAAVGMSSRFLGAAFLTRTLLPGVELPDDEMWQLEFDHFMTEDDYDVIIDQGWKKFSDGILFDKLGYDPEAMGKDFEAGQRNMQRYDDAGLPFAFSGMLSSPFDILAFSRGLTDFFVDLLECPEKIIEAMNVIMDEEEASRRDAIAQEVADNKARGEETLYVVAPCVQANCDLLSRAQFEEFGWPLIERQTNFLLGLGAKVRFHMDSNWTNVLDLFTCFPKGTCIFDSDGNTDLEDARRPGTHHGVHRQRRPGSFRLRRSRRHLSRVPRADRLHGRQLHPVAVVQHPGERAEEEHRRHVCGGRRVRRRRVGAPAFDG